MSRMENRTGRHSLHPQQANGPQRPFHTQHTVAVEPTASRNPRRKRINLDRRENNQLNSILKSGISTDQDTMFGFYRLHAVELNKGVTLGRLKIFLHANLVEWNIENCPNDKLLALLRKAARQGLVTLTDQGFKSKLAEQRKA